MDIYMILKYVAIAFIIFLFAILVGNLLNLINSLKLFLDEKSKSIAFQYSGKKILPIDEQIKCSDAILNDIDVMIEIECASILRTYIFLGKPYDILNLDKDAAKLSENVFKGIKKEVFKSTNLIYTDEYLIRYISNQSTLKLLERSRDIKITMNGQ